MGRFLNALGFLSFALLFLACSKSSRPMTIQAETEKQEDFIYPSNPNPGSNPAPSFSSSPSPSPDPSPTPGPGTASCTIERLQAFKSPGQPLSFKLNISGSVTYALINNSSIHPANPFSVSPDVNGLYKVVAIVANAAGVNGCEAEFQTPSCALSIKSQSLDKTVLEMKLKGALNSASIQGVSKTLPLPPLDTVTHTIFHSANMGPQTVVGAVGSSFGDAAGCSLDFTPCAARTINNVSILSSHEPLTTLTPGIIPHHFAGDGSKPAALVKDLKPGEIVQISNITGEYSLWGGLFKKQCTKAPPSDLNGVPVVQFSNALEQIIEFDGSSSSVQHAISITELLDGVEVPEDATKLVGSIPDTLYGDNQGDCKMTVTVIPVCGQ